MTAYQTTIENLKNQMNGNIIPRPFKVPANVVEASMRLQYSTLDHLSISTFREEIKIAQEMYDDDAEGCDALAKSYAL